MDESIGETSGRLTLRLANVQQSLDTTQAEFDASLPQGRSFDRLPVEVLAMV